MSINTQVLILITSEDITNLIGKIFIKISYFKILTSRL